MNDTKRRRSWTLLLFLLLLLLLLLPLALAGFQIVSGLIPERVTPETHLITGPRNADGSVNYGEALAQFLEKEAQDPGENGFRILARAFGPEIAGFSGVSDPLWRASCARAGLEAELASKFEPEFPDFLSRTADVREKWSAELKKPIQGKIAVEWDDLNAGLDRIAEAARMPYLMWRVDGDLERMQKTIEAFRSFSALLTLRAREALNAGDADLAVRDCLTIFYLAKHLTRFPSSLSAAGYGLENSGFQLLADILFTAPLPAAQLEEIRRELEILDQRESLDAFLQKEKLFTCVLMEYTWKTEPRLTLWHKKAFRRELVRNLNTVCAEDGKILGIEAPKSEPGWTAVAEKTHIPGLWGRLLGWELWRLERVTLKCMEETIRRNELSFRLARIAVETELFHRENGRYPETLAELALPDALFQDPFADGKPFTYRQNPESRADQRKRFDAWRKRVETFPEYYAPLDEEKYPVGTLIRSEEFPKKTAPALTQEEERDDAEFPSRQTWRPFLLFSDGAFDEDGFLLDGTLIF